MDNTQAPAIRDLTDKEMIQDRSFLVKDKNYGVGKNGKPFLSLLIGDKTGQLDARIWDNVEVLNEAFQSGDLIKVKGNVQIYNNRKQLVIHRLENISHLGFKPEDFSIESKAIDVSFLFSELKKYIQKIQSPHIQQLCQDCLLEEDVKLLLQSAPAAKSIHHAFKGGLLQHIVSICKLMEGVADNYPFLNKDLLIFGAIFHDFGKIWELEINHNQQITYTDKGQMLGHMYLCCEFIEKKSSRILGFPDDLKVVLKHIILSHHGRLEYGSPKVPLFPEAFVVAAIDDFDSKIEQIHRFVESERAAGDSWSRLNDNFQRFFFLENLKEKWR